MGHTYSIPLSSVFDATAYFNYSSDIVLTTAMKLNLQAGKTGMGVSYEAEGMPSGMKCNPVSGLLTWTPTKAQAGRYPITVKAVEDGRVLSTMSFDVFMVNYTGNSVSADACDHAKATKSYTLEDGTIKTPCPVCKTVLVTKPEETEALFKLVGTNMTLGNELSVNFAMSAADYKDGMTAKITCGGETVEVKPEKYSAGYYTVSYALSAKQMADEITVEIFKDGKAVSEAYTDSVRDYAARVLTKSGTDSKTKTMLVDMLNYGAEAQKYFSYNTADLANSKLTKTQKAYATKSAAMTDKRVSGKNYVGSNLTLGDQILLNMLFRNVNEAMTAKITYVDHMGETVTVETKPVRYDDTYCMVTVDSIVLADAKQLVTVTVYDGAREVASASDSVESYAARKPSALTDAVMKFATSAYNYFQ